MKYAPVIALGVVVAIIAIAINGFILAATGGTGTLLTLIAVNTGFARYCCGSRMRWARFWRGFVVSGLAALIAYICLIEAKVNIVCEMPEVVLDKLLPRFPGLMEAWDSIGSIRLKLIVLFEVSYGFPMITFASAGGALSVLLFPRGIEPPIHRGRVTIRGLMAVVAVVAVVMGSGVAFSKLRNRTVTVRVFNRTGAEVVDPQIGYQRLESRWFNVFGSMVQSGGCSNSKALAPGSMISWDVECLGLYSFTFYGTTLDGALRSGQIDVDVGLVYPVFVDYYVEDTIVRPAIIPKR